MMSNLTYGIRQPWELNKYYNNPSALGKILRDLKEAGRQFYVDQAGEPTVKVGGQWMGYEAAIKEEIKRSNK